MVDNTVLEELNPAAESSFNLDGVTFAKKVLDRKKKENILNECDFHKDLWKIERTNQKGTFFYLNFEILNSPLLQKLPKGFKNIVKCWTTYLLDNFSDRTVQNSLHQVTKFTFETYGFQIEKVVNFLDEMEHSEKSYNSKRSFFNSVYNLLDYSELINVGEVMILLQSFQLKLSPKQGIRIIPPPYWVFEFNRILESFFNELITNELTENIVTLKCFYTPVKIWWDLTTIIPIRPTEFCLIERNCLSYKVTNSGSLYYIKTSIPQLPLAAQIVMKKVRSFYRICYD